MKKILVAAAACLLVTAGSVFPAAALGEAYDGYVYNSWNNAVSAPNAYTVVDTLTGTMMGAGVLDTPTDMQYADGRLYILDSGNGRILVLDGDYRLERTIDTFTDSAGNPVELDKPQGFFVRADGSLIIANTEKSEVLFCNGDGSGVVRTGVPDAELFPGNIQYKPTKVLENPSGYVYILARDFYYGAVVMNPGREFIGFFGPNNVAVTARLLAERVWRLIFSEQQRNYLSNYVPVAFSNFDIDADNFIYTCTLNTQTGANQLKKLNNNGVDLFKDDQVIATSSKLSFGDKQGYMYRGQWSATQFSDMDISDSGRINALDRSQGRIFQYDQACNLLCIFGAGSQKGNNEQKGTFEEPVAIESIGSDILVLDTKKMDLTVFRPTEFGSLVHQAADLFGKGEYSRAIPVWQQVLKLDSNYEMAYVGIGRGLAQQQNYEDALWYLKRGYDRASYSTAYSVVRIGRLQQWFPLLGALALAAVVWIFFGRRIRLMVRRTASGEPQPRSTQSPGYVMFHPLDGYDNIRRTNRFTLLVGSVLLMLVWFVLSIVQRQATGFIFNLNRPETLDITLIFARTFGVMALWCACNWAVSTLINGEGSLRRIWIVSAYAMTPHVLTILLNTLLSNLVTYEEGALMTAITVIGIVWSAFLMIWAVKEVHQFSLMRTFASIFLTVVGMMLVMFVAVLFFSLIQQFMTFIRTIFNEIVFRTA